MDLDDPVAVALAISDCLNAADERHALYGGLLLAAYGEPRETKDADLAVVESDGAKVSALLNSALHLDSVVAFERQPFGGLLVSRVTLIDGEALNTLDLVEPMDRGYAARALGRALESTLRDCPIQVLTPEDFVIFKVLSSRERDLDDAGSVVENLGSELDLGAIDAEIAGLELSAGDHPVRARWASLRPPTRA